MATEVLMPKLGLTMTEGTIEEWKFKEGDTVKKGDILFSVATDKLTNDVEAEEDVDVTHIGEPNFILTYEDPRQKNTWISWCKTILVGILTFIGTAFSIMTFHTDIGVRELFLDVYTRFLPQMTPGFSVLEISYSIGIGLGVVLYFNHFGRRKFTQDPTPLEVEMRVYEDDIDTTIIEQNDRSGKGKEAFHANPARDPADHSRS